MSTHSLPHYAGPGHQPQSQQQPQAIPAYTLAPQRNERQLAMNSRIQPHRSSSEFVKQTKSGGLSLRLKNQGAGATVPTYGLSSSVQGTVDVGKPEGVTSVEVKVEGTLYLLEIAGRGEDTYTLCLSKSMLWVKNRSEDTRCPSSLPFSLPLPTTFFHSGKQYPLPPTYESKLSGLPGFRANIEYSVGITAIRPTPVPEMVKSVFKRDELSVATPFIYYPRSRPSVPVPPPLIAHPSRKGFVEMPQQWRVFPSTIKAREGTNHADIETKIYLPSTRIFSMGKPIPFHLTFACPSSPAGMQVFAPLAPVTGLYSPRKHVTRIQLMRQTIVDVRDDASHGTKDNIWRSDCIGEGIFQEAGSGPDWGSYNGEIFISDDVRVSDFKAGGLSIRDFIVFSVSPSDIIRAPFREMRQVLPVRLATDPWTEDGSHVGFVSTAYSTPASSEELGLGPELRYQG